MSGNLPSAGWFPDPQDGTQQRYWNGSEWTSHTAPGPAAGMQPYGSQAAYGGQGYQGYQGYVARETAPGATAALILGILSLVLAGFLTGIPAMIMSRRAKREIDAYPSRYEGRGLATAGFVTGLIGTILSVLAFVVLALGIAVGISQGTT